jgi:hypothetical protein
VIPFGQELRNGLGPEQLIHWARIICAGAVSGARDADSASGRLLFILKDDGTLVVACANPSRFEAIVSYTVADSATWRSLRSPAIASWSKTSRR